MKRNFASVYSENEQDGYRVGDQAAHVAAGALAQRLDAPTIARITDMVALLDTVGGQFYITALRTQDETDPATYNIEALVFNYETRDLKVQKYEPPEEIMGIPVTASHEAGVEVESPTEVPVEAAEGQEAEPDPEPLPAEKPEQYPVEV